MKDSWISVKQASLRSIICRDYHIILFNLHHQTSTVILVISSVLENHWHKLIVIYSRFLVIFLRLSIELPCFLSLKKTRIWFVRMRGWFGIKWILWILHAFNDLLSLSWFLFKCSFYPVECNFSTQRNQWHHTLNRIEKIWNLFISSVAAIHEHTIKRGARITHRRRVLSQY